MTNQTGDPKKKHYLISDEVIELDDNQLSQYSDMKPVEVALVSKDGGKNYSYVEATELPGYLQRNPGVLVMGQEEKKVSTPEGAKKRIETGVPQNNSGVSKEYSDKLSKMNFVQRFNQPEKFIKNADGTQSTHKMASASVDGKQIAFPTIVEKNGKLVELTVDQAIDYAMKTGEYAEFATEKDAQWYAEGGYKQGTKLASGEKTTFKKNEGSPLIKVDADKLLRPVQPKKVPLDVVFEEEKAKQLRSDLSMMGSERIDIAAPTFDQKLYEQATSKFEQMRRGQGFDDVPYNPTTESPSKVSDMRFKQMFDAEMKVKRLEGLKDGFYPLEDYADLDAKKGFTDYYLAMGQKEADRSKAGSFRAYSEEIKQERGEEYVPKEMRPELFATQAYEKTLEDYQQFLKAESNSPDYYIKKKEWQKKVSDAQKEVQKERTLTNMRMTKSITDMTLQIEGLKVMKAQGIGVLGIDYDERIQELEIQRRQLSTALKLVTLSEKGDTNAIEETLDTQNVPGRTAEERVANYFTSLLTADKQYAKKLEPSKNVNVTNPFDVIAETVGAVWNLQMGMTPMEKEGYFGLQEDLNAVAPVVMLRRLPVNQDTAGEVYLKTFAREFVPATRINISTAQQVAQKTQSALEYVSAKIDDAGQAETLKEISSPYENFSSKDWATMMGTTTAIMADMVLATPATNVMMKYTKLGRFIDKTSDTGKVFEGDGMKFFDALGSNKYGRGFTKAVFGGIKEGAKFEIAGEMFKTQEDELNFWSGFFGGVISSPISQIVEKSGKKAVQTQYARIFGNKSEAAIARTYNFGVVVGDVAKAGGRGVAEMFEEFGNEIGNLYRETDNWAEVAAGLQERFGDTSELFHFAVSSAVLGAGMSAGNTIGQYSTAQSKVFYNQLDPVEKAKFDEFMTQFSSEMKDVVSDVEADQKEAEAEQQPSNTEEVLEEIKAGEDGIVETKSAVSESAQGQAGENTVTFEGKRGQADSITFDGKTIKQGEEIELNDVNISQDDSMPDLRSGKYKVTMLSVDTNGRTAMLTLTDGNEVITTTVKDLRKSEQTSLVKKTALETPVDETIKSGSEGKGSQTEKERNREQKMQEEGLQLELAPLVLVETPETIKRAKEIEEKNAKVKARINEIDAEFDNQVAALKKTETEAQESTPDTEIKSIPADANESEIFASPLGEVTKDWSSDTGAKVKTESGTFGIDTTEDGDVEVIRLTPKKKTQTAFQGMAQSIVDEAFKAGKKIVVDIDTVVDPKYAADTEAALLALGFEKNGSIFTKNPEAQKPKEGFETKSKNKIVVENGVVSVIDENGVPLSRMKSQAEIIKNKEEFLDYAEANNLIPEGMNLEVFLGTKTQKEIDERNEINDLINMKSKYNNWNKTQRLTKPGAILKKKIEDKASELGFDVITISGLKVDIRDQAGKKVLFRPGYTRKGVAVDADVAIEKAMQKRESGEYDNFEQVPDSDGEFYKFTRDPFEIARGIINEIIPLGYSADQTGVVSSKEDAIAESLADLNTEWFLRDTDRKSADPRVVKAYTRKEGKNTLSSVASSASTTLNEDVNANNETITVKDVTGFMATYPRGVKEYYEQRSKPDYIKDYEFRFFEETGLPATPENIKKFADAISSKPEPDNNPAPFSRAKRHRFMKMEELSRLVDLLSKTGLQGDIIYDQESFDRKWEEGGYTGKKADGMVIDGVIYINPATVKADTLVHEFGHLWQKWAKQKSPVMHARGMKLIKDSQYYEDIKNDPNYAHLTTEEQILDEALARAIGDAGAKLLDATKIEKFGRWMDNLLRFVVKSMGVSVGFMDEVSDMTLEEFTTKVARALSGDIVDMYDGTGIDQTEASGAQMSVTADIYREQRDAALLNYEEVLNEELRELRAAYKDVSRTKNKKERQQSKNPKTLRGFYKKIFEDISEEDLISVKARLADIKQKYREEKRALLSSVPRERGSDFIVEKLSRAARVGDLDRETVDLAIDLVRKNPVLFEDLAISITKGEDSTLQGYYQSANSIVKIFKGATDTTKAVHELLHHTERFLPEDVREKIINEWHEQVLNQINFYKKKLDKSSDPTYRDMASRALVYLGMAIEMQYDPGLKNSEEMGKIMMKYLNGFTDSKGFDHPGLGQSFYRLFNPSEWWAVNASRMLKEAKDKPEMKGFIEKVKQFYSSLIESIKKIFVKSPTEEVEKALDAILNGDVLEDRTGSQMSAFDKIHYNIKTQPLGAQMSIAPESEEELIKKRRRFDETMENYSRSSQLRKMIEGNRLVYQVESNEEALDKATGYINRNGIRKSFDAVTGDPKNYPRLEEVSTQTVRMILIDTYSDALTEALANGDTGLSQQITDQLMILRDVTAKQATLNGRESQRLSIWKLMSPIAVVHTFQEMIAKANAEVVSDPAVIKEIEDLAKQLEIAALEIQDLKFKMSKQIDKNDKLQSAIERISKQRITDPVENAPSEPAGSRPTKKKGAKKITVSAEERAQAQAERSSIMDRIRARKGPLGSRNIPTASLTGWDPADIDDIGELALTFAKEGFYSSRAIAEAVHEMWVAEFGFAGDVEEIAEVMEESFEWKNQQKKNLEKKYKATSKGLMAQLKEIVQDHYSRDRIESIQAGLQERIQDELGLSEDESNTIAEIIENDIKQKTEKAARSIIEKTTLSNLPKAKNKKKPMIDHLVDNLMASQHTGDTNHYINVVMAYYGAEQLTKQEEAHLMKLAANVRAQVPGSIFYSQAVKQMAEFMVSKSPKSFSFTDAWIELYYASMLSGPSTSVLNMASVIVNEALMPFQDMTNISKHISMMKKGIKQDSVALAMMPDFILRWAATFSGFVEGFQRFRDTMAFGSSYSKYIGHLASSKGALGVRELEKNKYKGGRFIGGKLNPWNSYKYVPRFLDAQDSMNRTIIEARYFAEMIKRKMIAEGKSEDTIKSMLELINGKDIDMAVVNAQVQQEAARYKAISGNSLTKNQMKIRKNEIIREQKAKLAGLSQEQVEDVVRAADIAVFTGKRNGVLGKIATYMGNSFSNSRAKRIFSLPWVPFVNVVANVFEFMMDATPVYGLARSYGYSPSAWVQRVSDFKKGVPAALSPSGFIENSAQAGAAGSLAREKQLGRAWFGTVAFASLAMLFLPDDDDDNPEDNYFRITGGKSTFNENDLAYTIHIGDFKLKYINIPVLSIPLSILGNYSDRSFGNAAIPDKEDRQNRLALAMLTLGDSYDVLLSMSFMSGVKDIFTTGAEVMRNEPDKKTGVSNVEANTSYVTKKIIEKYAGLVTKPLPTNFGLVKQIEQIFDPTVYTRDDVQSMLWYSIGLERLEVSGVQRAYDIFGEEVQRTSFDNMMAAQAYFGMVKDTDKWQLLIQNNIVPDKAKNVNLKFDDGYRKLTQKEWAVALVIGGQNFSDWATEAYNDQEYLETRKKESEVKGTKTYNGVQVDILENYSNSMSAARQTVKSAIESGTFEELYKTYIPK